jgi:hypothetical protein
LDFEATIEATLLDLKQRFQLRNVGLARSQLNIFGRFPQLEPRSPPRDTRGEIPLETWLLAAKGAMIVLCR